MIQADNPILVSVVVPVYKIKEEYLRACVGSLLEQSLKEIEIILVDDGSPDRCGKICDKLAETDCRIRVIHQGTRVFLRRATGAWSRRAGNIFPL